MHAQSWIFFNFYSFIVNAPIWNCLHYNLVSCCHVSLARQMASRWLILNNKVTWKERTIYYPLKKELTTNKYFGRNLTLVLEYGLSIKRSKPDCRGLVFRRKSLDDGYLILGDYCHKGSSLEDSPMRLWDRPEIVLVFSSMCYGDQEGVRWRRASWRCL